MPKESAGRGLDGDKQMYKRYKRVEMQYNLLNQWMTLNEAGITLENLLEARGYQKIAIYGMANIGKHMYHALKNSSIEICYGMDRSSSGQYETIEVKKADEVVESVDALIVTAIADYESIKKNLENNLEFPIVSLEEILYETVCE